MIKEQRLLFMGSEPTKLQGVVISSATVVDKSNTPVRHCVSKGEARKVAKDMNEASKTENYSVHRS